MDVPDFRQDIQRLADQAEKVLEQLRPIVNVAAEPINQEAPPRWVPVGIVFDDDTRFECLMQPGDRSRLNREFFNHDGAGEPYPYRFSPDDTDRQLAIRVSDIHHLY